jgi:hypothetical protein
MANNFETGIGDINADMVSICLEYCENKAEEIFIHVIYEQDNIFPNFFFKMDGAMYKKGNLGAGIGAVAFPRQKTAMSIITENYKKMIALCEENKQPVPTEMRLVYNTLNGDARANYRYDSITTDKMTAVDVTGKWFSSIK